MIVLPKKEEEEKNATWRWSEPTCQCTVDLQNTANKSEGITAITHEFATDYICD